MCADQATFWLTVNGFFYRLFLAHKNWMSLYLWDSCWSLWTQPEQDLMKAKGRRPLLCTQINCEDSAVPKGQRSGPEINPSSTPYPENSRVSTLGAYLKSWKAFDSPSFVTLQAEFVAFYQGFDHIPGSPDVACGCVSVRYQTWLSYTPQWEGLQSCR